MDSFDDGRRLLPDGIPDRGCCTALGCSCLPKSRGGMLTLARIGDTSLILGPHIGMLLLTYIIIITISVVIYGLVLTTRQDVEIIIGGVLTALCLLSLTLLALKDPGVCVHSSVPCGEGSTFCEKCKCLSNCATATAFQINDCCR